MKISREARRMARELFRFSLANGRLDANRVSEISQRLLTEKPRSYLQILKELARLVRLELDKRHAVIESAVPLNEASASNIANTLKRQNLEMTSPPSFAPRRNSLAGCASSSAAMSGTVV